MVSDMATIYFQKEKKMPIHQGPSLTGENTTLKKEDGFFHILGLSKVEKILRVQIASNLQFPEPLELDIFLDIFF